MLKNKKIKDSRKTLQSLQPLADNLHLLVPSPSTVNRGGRKLVKTNPVEKENATANRQLKRKNVNSDELKMAPSKEEVPSKTQKSKSSKPSKRKMAVAKNSEKKLPDACQTSLDSFVADASMSNNRQEEPSTSINDTATNAGLKVPVFEDQSEEVNLLTSDTPSMAYWKDMAEQRRLALEKALTENAQLVDQLEVLQTENMQLKSTLKEAENFLGIINASL